MNKDNESFLQWIQLKHSSDRFCSDLVEACRAEFTRQEGKLDEDRRSAIYKKLCEEIYTKQHALLRKHFRVRCNS